MSLENVILRIKEQTVKKKEELQKLHEEKITQLDLFKAEKIKQCKVEEEARSAEELSVYQRTLVDSAEKERMRFLSQMKQACLQEIFSVVEEQLQQVSQTESFKPILVNFFTEALKIYKTERSDKPQVYTAKAHFHLLKSSIKEELSFFSDDTLTTGVMLLSPDGEFKIVNTLFSRFEKGKGHFRKLFDDSWEKNLK